MKRSVLVGLIVSALAGCDQGPPAKEDPHPLDNGLPVYPKAEQKSGHAGTVIVDCGLTETGITHDCVVKAATNPAFAASALAFARRARYQPARKDGKPVAVAHHIYELNFTMASRTTVQSASCDVEASGRVQNCRSTMTPVPASWPILKTVLERSLATPNTEAGHAVAEQNRPISLAINTARLPLAAPMTDPPGDSVLSFTTACSPVPDEPGTPLRCVLVASQPAEPGAAGIRYVRVRVGIVGLVAPDMGDFTQ